MDSGRLEQIVSHFVPKALHIVVDSRIPCLPSGSVSVKKSDKWFNLVMASDCPNLPKSNSIVIDIILLHPPQAQTLIERWLFHYDDHKKLSSDSSTTYQKVYKKSIILLRSLYAHTRLLPAYRLSRQLLSSSSSSLGYDIIYKVSSFSDVLSGPAMNEFRFEPVQVPPGSLCASVTYRSDLSDFNLGAHITLPPRIITDYVGSPATDPMRFFPSPGTFRAPADHRPHSWTSGFHRPPGHYATPAQFDFRMDGFGDSHQLSPPFSPSPRYTAPVTIPSSAAFNRYMSSNFSEPSRNPLPPFSPKSTRSGESMNHYPAHKLSKDSKYDSGRFSGLLSSSGSPRFGFSRSPSRLSSQDDLDDPDCSCPFDFDDVDDSGLQYSQSLDRRKTSSSISQSLPIGRKSQDAAVGVLVHMLKTAPPLRQDSSTYVTGLQREGSVSVSVAGTESEFSMALTTSDALEELRNYKQLKDLLLSKSKTASGATRVH